MTQCSGDLENKGDKSSKGLPNSYPFKNPNFFSLEGRINRAKYLWTMVTIGIVGTVAITVWPTNVTVIAANILCFFPIIKRLHDIDVSGGFGLLAFIPGANVILGILLLFKKGTFGANKYGDDPLLSTGNNKLQSS